MNMAGEGCTFTGRMKTVSCAESMKSFTESAHSDSSQREEWRERQQTCFMMMIFLHL